MTASGMSQVYSRVCTVLLAVAAVAAGCGGGLGDKEPHQTGFAAGLAVYEVPGESFSIGVPKSWNALSADRIFKGGSLDAFTAQNPDLKPFLDAVRAPSSP